MARNRSTRVAARLLSARPSGASYDRVPIARPVLACSVRGCGLPLERRDPSLVCPAGHTFDIARSGYVNLLQPQDRRSPDPGDSRESVEARARLLEAGVGRLIIDALVARAAALEPPADAVVVDLGAGSGEVLAALDRLRDVTAIGIDLSTAAADRAARHFPTLTWVVANADRRLPVVDAAAAIVLSLNGRRNPAECRRVLAPGGHLLVAVPAPDDLVELREAVMGDAPARDRAAALLAEHEPFFTLIERGAARERHRLERDQLVDLLRGTYRGSRTSAAGRIAALDVLEVTLASEFFLFAPRPLP